MLSASFTALLASGGEGGGEKDFWASAYPVIPHPAELVVGTVAFLVLLFVVQKAVVPMVEKVYSERAAAIEGGMEKAEKAQAEAEAMKADYKAQLASSREEAGRLREEARAEAAAIVAEARKRAQAEADRIIESAHKQVEVERQHAMVSLRSDIGGLATTLAGRIVGESLEDHARQSRVIDRFLTELEGVDSTSRES